MEQFELSEQIRVVAPIVTFEEYEKLKSQAAVIAENLLAIKVTEENVKSAKKVLAEVNKRVALLNQQRIAIKNEILKPYDSMAAQVKEIESIVKIAEDRVREQVRELEETEREKKRVDLETIWADRIGMYEYAKVLNISDWIEPMHLNKTQTVKKSEEEMTAFLERSERDIETLSGMASADDLIHEYRQSKDMASAIQTVAERKRKIAEQTQVLKASVETIEPEEFLFVVIGEKDKKLTELLLKENGIEFIVRR